MSTSQTIINIQGVSKHFGGDVRAVDEVSLEIHAGEFFALLGPSGCGKTTLLRILAGLESPSAGSVFIDGEDMRGVAANRRNVNMVFQSYAVFPHMNVFDNVAYGLKVSGVPGREIAPRVREALELVKLTGLEVRRPHQLSGGQRQRVALARALVKRPRVLLLDEPLSALDAKLREAMQIELVRLQQSVGITFVIVTHDQDEALSMADRIAVMESGRVRQIASPRQLYEEPASRFVADFIGKMNLLEARRDGDGVLLTGLSELRLACPDATPPQFHVALRPEKVRVLEAPEPDALCVRCKVDALVYHGSESHIFALTDGDPAITLNATVANITRSAAGLVRGDTVWLAWSVDDMVILTE